LGTALSGRGGIPLSGAKSTVRIFALLVLTSVAHAASFDEMVKAYYAELPAARPVAATELGFHTHDGDLDDLSAAGIKREIARLKGWRDKFAAHKPTATDKRDYIVLTHAIDSRLFELEKIQKWKHWPGEYPDHATSGVYVIIKREFAPAEARLRSTISRERKVPALLAEAKRNLTAVPKVAQEIALDQLPGTVDFFKTDVPAAFTSVKDKALLKELNDATAGVVAALADYEKFVKGLPTVENFAIGEAAFREKLRVDELVEEPLDTLLKRGEAELGRLQKELVRVAATVDKKRAARDVLGDIQRDHESAKTLIGAVGARLIALRKFVVDKDLLTIPSTVMPLVQETPPFMRATTLASMETPGPFETKATEAYYNVTLPDTRWDAAQVEDYLRGAFSKPVVDVTSIHEAFPGHYVQFLWVPKIASTVRKYEGPSTNIEGWAHYCEQMIVDEGFGGGDSKLRLGQLQDALLRAARFVVGIRMHTRGMTLAQAVDFFEKEGYQSHKVGEMEARRGAGDPTYLYYTLGKLEILKLRDDYKKKLGPAFTLKKFHDAFLAEGPLPLPLLREALLN
jgi:hypothetical protein